MRFLVVVAEWEGFDVCTKLHNICAEGKWYTGIRSVQIRRGPRSFFGVRRTTHELLFCDVVCGGVGVFVRGRLVGCAHGEVL